MISAEIHHHSKQFVIAFTGFGGRLLVENSRFMKEAGLESASRVIINDPDRAMCLGGVRGHSESFPALVQKLEKMYTESGATSLTIVGASGGGYTALLMAHILRADICVVFSPYPYLSVAEAERLNDPIVQGYPRLIKFFSELPQDLQALLNIKDALAEWNGKTEYFVHVAKYNVWDQKRAQTIAHLPHLEVIEHPYGQHDVVKFILSKTRFGYCFKPGQKAYFEGLYKKDEFKNPVSINLKPKSEILLIVFTDHRGNILTSADFFLKKIGVRSESTIVVNDTSRSACFFGTPGLGDSITDVMAALQNICHETQAKKIVTMGAYFGAHTALLAGHLLKADLCVTFSPFPSLKCGQDDELDAELQKFRGLFRRCNKAPADTQEYLDLNNILPDWNKKTEYIVHAPAKHEGEMQRARVMAGLPHTTVICHPCNRGGLPSILKKIKHAPDLLYYKQTDIFKDIYGPQAILQPPQTVALTQGTIPALRAPRRSAL